MCTRRSASSRARPDDEHVLIIPGAKTRDDSRNERSRIYTIRSPLALAHFALSRAAESARDRGNPRARAPGHHRIRRSLSGRLESDRVPEATSTFRWSAFTIRISRGLSARQREILRPHRSGGVHDDWRGATCANSTTASKRRSFRRARWREVLERMGRGKCARRCDSAWTPRSFIRTPDDRATTRDSLGIPGRPHACFSTSAGSRRKKIRRRSSPLSRFCEAGARTIFICW